MSDFDVHPDDMTDPHAIDDRAAEDILAGRAPRGRDDLDGLAAAVRDVREDAAVHPPRVDAQLAHAFTHGLEPEGASDDAAALVPAAAAAAREPAVARATWVDRVRGRGRRMLAMLSTVLGTVIGKVALGTAAAVASVGGAHAAGVVEVPVLPEVAGAGVEAAEEAGAEDEAAENDEVANEEEDAGPPEHAEGADVDPDEAGVDGDEVSAAARGEDSDFDKTPEDGRDFGWQIRNEAIEGTPAAERVPDEPGPPDDVPGDGPPEGVPAEGDGPPEGVPAEGPPEDAGDQRPDDAGDQAGDAGQPDETPAGSDETGDEHSDGAGEQSGDAGEQGASGADNADRADDAPAGGEASDDRPGADGRP